MVVVVTAMIRKGSTGHITISNKLRLTKSVKGESFIRYGTSGKYGDSVAIGRVSKGKLELIKYDPVFFKRIHIIYEVLAEVENRI